MTRYNELREDPDGKWVLYTEAQIEIQTAFYRGRADRPWEEFSDAIDRAVQREREEILRSRGEKKSGKIKRISLEPEEVREASLLVVKLLSAVNALIDRENERA